MRTQFWQLVFLCLGLATSRAAEPQEFFQEIARHREWTNGLPAGALTKVALADGTVLVRTASGKWFARNGNQWAPKEDFQYPETALAIVVAGPDEMGRVWTAESVAASAADSKGRLWIAAKAGVAVRDGEKWKFYEGKDGLPWNEFTCATKGRNEEMWFGTKRGAIWWDGKEFHYRQGFRWLPNGPTHGLIQEARQRTGCVGFFG